MIQSTHKNSLAIKRETNMKKPLKKIIGLFLTYNYVYLIKNQMDKGNDFSWIYEIGMYLAFAMILIGGMIHQYVEVDELTDRQRMVYEQVMAIINPEAESDSENEESDSVEDSGDSSSD